MMTSQKRTFSIAAEKFVFLFMLCCLMLFAQGCSAFGYKEVAMTCTIVNDANQVLSVEGSANLPDGCPVSAELSENEDLITSSKSQVLDGKFCLTVDLSRAPGNSPLNLEVFADPSKGPDNVLDSLGDDGSFMLGSQVEDYDGINRLVERMRVVLPMSRREAAIRRVKFGDYDLGISNLEGVIELNSKDYEACAWLAMALLNRSSIERQKGSRAHDLLKSAHVDTLPEPLRSYSKAWFDRWQEEEAEELAIQERRDAIVRNRQEAQRSLSIIKPGVSLAGVKLGMTDREVFALSPTVKSPPWTGDPVEYYIPDRDVTVYFGFESHQVVEVTTTSPEITLKEGVGVGSELNQVESYYTGGRLLLGDATIDDSGVRVQTGEYLVPAGVVFGITRKSTEHGILSDRVTSVSVMLPFEW